MTLKGMNPADLPTTERKTSVKLTKDQIKQAVELLNAGQVVTDDRTHKNEGAARRSGLQLRALILAEHPTLAISSRVWPDGEMFRSGVSLKDDKEDKTKVVAKK